MVDLDPPKINKKEPKGDLQDGMLFYYKTQAPMQDAQIEARIEREPFFLNQLLDKTILNPRG